MSRLVNICNFLSESRPGVAQAQWWIMECWLGVGHGLIQLEIWSLGPHWPLTGRVRPWGPAAAGPKSLPHIWNRDRLHKIRVFGTYSYFPGTYRYIPVHTGTWFIKWYMYVCTGMYQVCTGKVTCKFDINLDTVFAFLHHCLHVQHSEYHNP